MLEKYLNLFKCLNDRDARYVVIGGIAAVMHGVPRMTFDIDLLIDPTEENARRILDAFLDANVGTASLTTAEQLLSKEITVFKDFIRIDVQTHTPGITFADASSDRAQMSYHNQSFWVLSIDALIRSTEASGKPTDLDDVDVLTTLANEANGA